MRRTPCWRGPAAALLGAALLGACAGPAEDETSPGGDDGSPIVTSTSPTPEQDELYAKVRDIQDAQHLLATQQVVLGGPPVQRSTFTVVPGTGSFEGETTFFDPRSGEETITQTRGVGGAVWLTFDEWSPPGQDECWLDSTGGLARLGVDPTGPGELYQDLGPYPRNLDTGVDYAAVGSLAARRAS